MKYVYLIFNWVFGGLFLLTGFVTLLDSPLGGLCLITISLLLLPPSRNFVYSKTSKELPIKARAVTIFAFFIAYGVFVSQDQHKKEQELAAQQAQKQAVKAAQLRQKNIDYFNTNKDAILAQASAALSQKDYQAVVSQTSRYLLAGNEMLQQINATAKTALAEKQKAEKTESLLAKLKKIPASEFEQNRELYQQLSAMHPSNDQYKNKLAHYSTKIEEEKQAQIAAAARMEKIKRQFSAWDGSHNNLERLIKKAMNDPDSYEHDETVYWDKGSYLIVKTTYRGKNAFGGVVRNFVKAKVSLDGDILQILDQT